MNHMHEYHSIDEIFHDIHLFIIDYIKLSRAIYETKGDRICVKLGEENFYLSATFNEFSQRANELQYRLKSPIRFLAQKRRYEISKGIDSRPRNNPNKSSRFKIDFEDLHNQLSDPNLSHIQIIIDSLELYDDIQTTKSFFDITFRLLPILKHIQKQVENEKTFHFEIFLFLPNSYVVFQEISKKFLMIANQSSNNI